MSGLLSVWVFPPLNGLLLLIAGLLVRRWRPRLALGLLLGGIALLWVCGAPVVAERTLRALEVEPPSGPLTGTGAGAIVILSGGTYANAPEYGTDTVGPWTLERLRYGARLHRQTGLPVLVTGAPPLGVHSSEAEQMRDALEQDLATPVRWLEPTGTDTLENAVASEKLLREEGMTKVLLVTHACTHAPRAARFRARRPPGRTCPHGLHDPRRRQSLSRACSPARGGCWMTRTAWHEMIGLAWYRLRFAFS